MYPYFAYLPPHPRAPLSVRIASEWQGYPFILMSQKLRETFSLNPPSYIIP